MSYPAFASGRVVLRSTTPRSPHSSEIQSLCRRLTPSGESVLLPFSKVDGRYRAGFCHVNVMHRTRDYGGHREYGWLIWECRGIIAEAEFHSVWRSPAGSLVDLTPRVDKERFVMFVPDPERRLERHGAYDKGWANYSSHDLHPEPFQRVLIARDERLARLNKRLGFLPDEPLS